MVGGGVRRSLKHWPGYKLTWEYNYIPSSHLSHIAYPVAQEISTPVNPRLVALLIILSVKLSSC